MTEINFQPVFDFIDAKFEYELGRFRDEILTEVRGELREVRDQIANLVTDHHRFHEEQEVANHRIDRLEKWAEPVSKKTNIPFKY